MFGSDPHEAYPTNAWLPYVVVCVYYAVGGYLSFTYGGAFFGLSIFLLTTAAICSRWRGIVLSAGPRTTRQIPPQPIPKCLQLSATALHEAFKEGALRSVDVTLAYIRLIRAVNPYINAIVFECFEEAIRSATQADKVWEEWRRRGRWAGEPEPSMVLGVPCTVKECMLCIGCPNTSGNPTREGLVAKRDSQVVHNFRRAGAVILGVTNTSELCMWYESSNYVYGMSCNPYDTRCIVGGSSGGEGAAAGASFACFGIGSDIGGSIRMPAFFNGVYGFKATPHLISNEGQFPGAKASANHFMATGPITRFAEDLFPLARLAAFGGFHMPPEEYPPAAPFSLLTCWPVTPWDRYYYPSGRTPAGVSPSRSWTSLSAVHGGGGRLSPAAVSGVGRKGKGNKMVMGGGRRGRSASVDMAMGETEEEVIQRSREARAIWNERKRRKSRFMTTLSDEREEEEKNFPWKEKKNSGEEEHEDADDWWDDYPPSPPPTWRGIEERECGKKEGKERAAAPIFSLSTFPSSSPRMPETTSPHACSSCCGIASTTPLPPLLPPTLRIFVLEDYGARFIPVSQSQKMAVRIAGEALARGMRKAGIPVEITYIDVRNPKRCTGGVVPPPFPYFADSFSMWVHALSSDPSENTFVHSMADTGGGKSGGGGEEHHDPPHPSSHPTTDINWIAELLRWCFRRSRHTFPAISLCVLETLEKSVPKFLSFGRAGSLSLDIFQREMENLLGDHGVLIAPTFPTAAPRHHQPLWNPFQFQYTAVFNVLQLPAVACPIWVGEEMQSRPCAFTPEAYRDEQRGRRLPKDFHLPKGVQLVGKRNTDEMLLGLALVLDEQCQGYRYPCWADLKN